MTWTRLRTWIGTHPVWAVNLGMLTAVALGVMLFFAVVACAMTFGISLNIAQTVIVVLVPALIFAVSLVSAAIVALLLGRSGQSTLRVMKYAALAPLIAAIGFAVLLAMTSLFNLARGRSSPEVVWQAVLTGWLLVSTTLGVGHLVGWAVAAIVTQHKRARGQWETTVPLPPPQRMDVTGPVPPPEAKP